MKPILCPQSFLLIILFNNDDNIRIARIRVISLGNVSELGHHTTEQLVLESFALLKGAIGVVMKESYKSA
ncbi:MAG: hypothetical protein GF311_09870 [Candidatus Lokiarchaeota archaeon]|nr:hypothetical protein [Candidatus Lokiarchaeota archaeon]